MVMSLPPGRLEGSGSPPPDCRTLAAPILRALGGELADLLGGTTVGGTSLLPEQFSSYERLWVALLLPDPLTAVADATIIGAELEQPGVLAFVASLFTLRFFAVVADVVEHEAAVRTCRAPLERFWPGLPVGDVPQRLAVASLRQAILAFIDSPRGHGLRKLSRTSNDLADDPARCRQLLACYRQGVLCDVDIVLAFNDVPRREVLSAARRAIPSHPASVEVLVREQRKRLRLEGVADGPARREGEGRFTKKWFGRSLLGRRLKPLFPDDLTRAPAALSRTSALLGTVRSASSAKTPSAASEPRKAARIPTRQELEALLPDTLWTQITPFFDGMQVTTKVKDRDVLLGVLWVGRYRGTWQAIPRELGVGSGMTCLRRLRAWQAKGVWDNVLPYLESAGVLGPAEVQLLGPSARPTSDGNGES